MKRDVELFSTLNTDTSNRHPARDLGYCVLVALIGLVVLLGGCDAWQGGGEDPVITAILDVRVEPNPVVVGDTALFTCVISDSLQPGFRYTWFIGNLLENVITDTSQYQWAAPMEPGTYRHKVDVWHPEIGGKSPQKPFEVTVVPQAPYP